MARIIGQKEQQAALKKIKNLRKDIENANEFLEKTNDNSTFSFSFTDEEGSTCTSNALVVNKAEVDKFVREYKNNVVDYVIKLSQEHRLEFELDEKLVFGFDLTPEEQEEYEKRLAEEEQEEENIELAMSSLEEE